MKKLIISFVLILFLANIFIISALCEQDQIDINTASNEELDGLYGIGPVKAEAIINSRPFQSVDELIKVFGIGNITLNKIKEQGLACVNEETEEINEKDKELEENNKNISENNLSQKELLVTEFDSLEISQNKLKKIEPKVIKLNTQNIKSEENKENLNKNNYAIYGFVIFCVLISFLFVLKKNWFNKNEFRQ